MADLNLSSFIWSVADLLRGEALEIIDRAIELGFLPAAPAARACAWCDFRPVCGPHEEQRVAMKPADKLGDLDALREMP